MRLLNKILTCVYHAYHIRRLTQLIDWIWVRPQETILHICAWKQRRDLLLLYFTMCHVCIVVSTFLIDQNTNRTLRDSSCDKFYWFWFYMRKIMSQEVLIKLVSRNRFFFFPQPCMNSVCRCWPLKGHKNVDRP